MIEGICQPTLIIIVVDYDPDHFRIRPTMAGCICPFWDAMSVLHVHVAEGAKLKKLNECVGQIIDASYEVTSYVHVQLFSLTTRLFSTTYGNILAALKFHFYSRYKGHWFKEF